MFLRTGEWPLSRLGGLALDFKDAASRSYWRLVALASIAGWRDDSSSESIPRGVCPMCWANTRSLVEPARPKSLKREPSSLKTWPGGCVATCLQKLRWDGSRHVRDASRWSSAIGSSSSTKPVNDTSWSPDPSISAEARIAPDPCLSEATAGNTLVAL